MAISHCLCKPNSFEHSINLDSPNTIIQYCLKRGMFSIKNIVDYIQTIYEGLNLKQFVCEFIHFR